jgi:hypothetical protein
MDGLKPKITRMFLEAEGDGDNGRYYYKESIYSLSVIP